MTRFVDEYLPDCVLSYDTVGSPRFNTKIQIMDSGAEQVDRRWLHPLHDYSIPEGVRDMVTFNALRDFWLVMGGPAHLWPFKDPFDYASVPITSMETDWAPTLSDTDQVLGNANGTTTEFQLMKLHQRGSQQYSRTILLPVVSTVVVAVDGVSQPSGWSVSRQGGVVTFDTPPASGAVTAGFRFDVLCRFEDDSAFDAVARSFNASGYSDIQLKERRFLD
jgi:uncharacterized protein (TIGR02217 family)